MKITNINVHEFNESLIASGYPMRTEAEMREVTFGDIKRGINLTKASKGNAGHGQWLTGVQVAFDLTCSNKMWVEVERYKFLNFVSSQSTMHRITKFDMDKCCNKYVDKRIIDIVKEKILNYNRATLDYCNLPEEDINKIKSCTSGDYLKELYLDILYNIPSGFELTARLTTNYRCLLNIYNQRHDHRLPEWREFCWELLKLPYFKLLVDAYCYNKDLESEKELQR